jgi:transposase
MSRKAARKYSDEFKRQAVELASRVGPTEAARKLGIVDGNIHNWTKKFGEKRPSVVMVSSAQEEEIKRLRKENADLKKANTILKAAAAFFSQDHLK